MIHMPTHISIQIKVLNIEQLLILWIFTLMILGKQCIVKEPMYMRKETKGSLYIHVLESESLLNFYSFMHS